MSLRHSKRLDQLKLCFSFSLQLKVHRAQLAHFRAQLMDTVADTALKEAELRFLQWSGKKEGASIGAAARRILLDILDEDVTEIKSKIDLLKDHIAANKAKSTTFEEKINALEMKINALQSGEEKRVGRGKVAVLP